MPPVDRRRGSVLFVTGEPWITEFVLMIENLGHRTVRLSTPRSLPAALSVGLAGCITGVLVPWSQMTKEVSCTLRKCRERYPALSVIVAGRHHPCRLAARCWRPKPRRFCPCRATSRKCAVRWQAVCVR